MKEFKQKARPAPVFPRSNASYRIAEPQYNDRQVNQGQPNKIYLSAGTSACCGDRPIQFWGGCCASNTLSYLFTTTCGR